MNPIIYPNNVNADASELRNYILNVCNEHKATGRALAFAFIISDLENPHINKILRDSDYMNALHNISGKFLTVFFVNDRYARNVINEAKDSTVMRLELGVEPIDGIPNVTPKQLANILINGEILSSPSILFFQIDKFVIKDHFITNLYENKIEEGFLEMKDLITTAVRSFAEVADENKGNSDELFELLRQSVNSAEFWKKTNKKYERFMKIKDFLFFWK